MTDPGAVYRRTVEGHEYEWREGPRGLGWYNDANHWFLTHDEAEQRSTPATFGADQNTMGMLAHVLAIFTSFLGPLVIYLVSKDAPKARANAAEALNFEISLAIAWIVAAVLFIVIIGIVFLPVLFVAGLVFPILGAVEANRGGVYRYPISIRFVSP